MDDSSGQCVCDSSKNFETDNAGQCKCKSGFKRNGGACEIDCNGQGQVLKGDKCDCDSDKGFVQGVSGCQCAEGFELENGKCKEKGNCGIGDDGKVQPGCPCNNGSNRPCEKICASSNAYTCQGNKNDKCSCT